MDAHVTVIDFLEKHWPAIGGLVAAIMIWIKQRAMTVQVHEIHMTMNSRLDELVSATRLAATAQGAKEEQARVAAMELISRIPPVTHKET